MNIIFIGDIVAGISRAAICSHLPSIKHEFSCDFCVANAENSAGGAGVTEKVLREFPLGLINVFTGGDHIWDQKEFQNEINSIDNFLRPANLKSSQPGRGWGIFKNSNGTQFAVISLIGRVFMKENFAECPFETADKLLSQIPKDVKNIIIDFHAEATSEKAALARYLDGKVSAVIGTHTHVQTNDETIFQNGTAFISDVGMVGPAESILGREISDVIHKFTSGMPTRLAVAKGPINFNAVNIKIDKSTGKAIEISKIKRLFY